MPGTVTTLDLKGLSCPLPIVKTAHAMRGLLPGDELEVYATDPGSVPDFKAWATKTRNTLVSASEEDGIYRFILRKE